MQRAGADPESIGFDSELLKHRDVKVAQRDTTVGFFRELFHFAVPEATPCEDDRKVSVCVRVGVPHAGSKESHRAIEQGAVFTGFANRLESVDEPSELFDLVKFNLNKFLELFRDITVM